jgi:quercetin dioxygenase-like cupin family protein
MKYILPAFLLLGLIALGGAVWADPPARVGRLSFLDGTVSYSAAPGEKWETAALNYPLTAGNLLSTGQESRSEVQIGSAAVRLSADTEVSFDALDDQTVQVRLDKGSASVRLRQLDQGQTFQVDIPTASISLTAPGSYRIDQKNSGEAVLTTREGDAEVTGGQTTFEVQAGQAATIPPQGPDAYGITQASPPDAWDQWVAARDERDDQVASLRYVSSEMDGGADLDNYGSWQIIAGYGPCWFPAAIPIGWAPYTRGHWVWVAPWGWTWVDYEPWGFAPFHYGRWASYGGAWCWVPGPIVAQPVFSPALVRWVGSKPWRGHPPDGERISWAPLRPYQ